MNNKPLVSVIVIFFNAEKFLREAIDSVLTQTYDNWELLLVDDGSTDRSTDIALEYVKEHSLKNIKYLKHNEHMNYGMSASRNLGIRHAKGEYITFLDSDDVWLPYKLQEQAAILELQPAAEMVYGPAQCWHSWKGGTKDVQHDFIQDIGIQPNRLIKPPGLLTLFLQNEGSIPSPSGIMICRKALEKIGGFENAFYGTYEDQVFLAKFCLERPVFVADRVWYLYRQHPDSYCSLIKKASQYHSARLIFLTWLSIYLTEHAWKNAEVWTALKKNLRPYRHPVIYSILGKYRSFATRVKRAIKFLHTDATIASLRRGHHSQNLKHKKQT